MTAQNLEQQLAAWLADDVARDADPSSVLLARIVAIPERSSPTNGFVGTLVRPPSWRFAGVLLLLLALAVTVVVVAGALLNLRNTVKPVLAPAEPCDLLTESWLEASFGWQERTLRDYPVDDWYPYARDWEVPQAAAYVLGPGTPHCEYAPRDGARGGDAHLELFLRPAWTSVEEAGSLTATLFEGACRMSRDPAGSDSCNPSQTTINGLPAVMSTGDAAANHLAISVAAEPHLFVLSAGFDNSGRLDVMRALAAHVASELAGFEVAGIETPGPGAATVGERAPELAGQRVGGGLFSLAASVGRPVVVLMPPRVGPTSIEDPSFVNLVRPLLDDLLEVAAAADPATVFVVIAEPDLDWAAIRASLARRHGPVADRIVFVWPHDTVQSVFDTPELYRLDPPTPGPAKLVVIDQGGRVAAIYPWLQPEPEDVAAILRAN